jgi:hypothetical protein
MLRNVAHKNSVEGVDVVCLPQESGINEMKSSSQVRPREQASLRCEGYI